MPEKKPQIIEQNHTIQDIFDMYPALKFKMITALSASGLQCVGPESDLNKTLEQAIQDQGKDVEALDNLLRNLNAAVPDAQLPLFELTDRAVSRIENILTNEEKDDWGMKFGLKPGGCSGFEYIMSFEEKPSEEDKVYEVNTVKLFVADRDLEKLKHSKIDFEETMMSSGFKVYNPNATGSCGCGISNSF